nr:DNA alkylation repair protein [Gammaproteobacteria bacterium]
MKLTEVQKQLRDKANPDIAEHSKRFFKTGKGEYGYGDKFLGVRVPIIRKIAKSHRDVSVDQCLNILSSRYHEERLLALI